MKILLRSNFIADVTDVEALLTANLHSMVESGIGFETVEDEQLWEYIREFFRAHNHLPHAQTLRDHFDQNGKKQVVDRLEQIIPLKPKTRGDFLTHLQDKVTTRKKRVIHDIARNMVAISDKGHEFKDVKGKVTRLEGPVDAIRYVLDQSHDLVAPTTTTRLSGNLMVDGEKFLNRYDQIKSDPRFGLGQFTGIAQIDEALKGAKRGELWIHAGWTGHCKCVAAETKVWDLKTGLLRTVGEIFASGDTLLVHALDERTMQTVVAKTSPVIENGIQPLIEVTTESNRSTRVTANHPLLTQRGWVPAGELTNLDWLAIPRQLLALDPTPGMTSEEATLLGYMLGDGSMVNSLSFSNTSLARRKDFARCLRTMGYAESIPVPGKKYQGMGYRMNSRGVYPSNRSGSPLRELLDRLGLMGHGAGGKFIPPEVWTLPESILWKFIGALWATDGTVSTMTRKNRKGRKDNAQLAISHITKSKSMAFDLRLLLQRMGMAASVNPAWVTYKGERRQYWMTQLTTRNAKTKFLEFCAPVGKEREVLRAKKALSQYTQANVGDVLPTTFLQHLPDQIRVRTGIGWQYVKNAKKRKSVERETARKFALEAKDETLMQMLDGNVRWEKIRSLTPKESEMTYDLCVPGYANFVADGFYSHNSSFALQWAYIQAVYYGYSSLYFSLEMPLEQVNNMIYTMHSAHEDFREIRQQLGIVGLGLDYAKLKYGKLEPNEEQFLREYVVPDINKTPTVPHNGPYSLDPRGYGDILIEIPDPDKHETTVPDLRHRAELLFAKTPFAMIFVDHAGLLHSRKSSITNTTERLNEALRDLKKMAMGFNRGLGMAVVALFQISREGFKAAEKNGGRYNLTYLSYASEAERSADVVTSGWLGDEVKKLGRLIIQCLKTRDEGGFDRVPVRVEFPSRRFLTDRTPIDEIDEKVKAAQAQAMPPQPYKKGGNMSGAPAVAPPPLSVDWADT